MKSKRETTQKEISASRAPLFEKMELLEKAQKHIRNAKTTLSTLNDRNDDQKITQLKEKLQQLESAVHQIENHGFPVSEEAKRRREPFAVIPKKFDHRSPLSVADQP